MILIMKKRMVMEINKKIYNKIYNKILDRD